MSGVSLLDERIENLDPNLMMTSSGRRKLTALDPMAFALIYLRHHLKNDKGDVTLSHVHLDWVEDAEDWITRRARRDAYIAPRNTGKSTWFFLILPMWAAAHGHCKFAAAFADSGTQAETHLTTFKNELDTNKLLRADFPDLTRPARREHGGTNVADNRSLMVMKNGFAFAARGIDAANLGLKIDANRPDLLIFDDVEPDESAYSQYQAKKRLSTVLEAILPMNLEATVVMVGTVTMAGGIMHQLVQSAQSNLPVPDWIRDEKVNVHYYEPILTTLDGEEASIWPEKWSLRYLKSVEHTRSFAKNFRNKPITSDGEYWVESDIVYNRSLLGITRTVISIDPAITTRKTSDFTGIVNVAFRPGHRGRDHTGGASTQPKCLVQEALAVKLAGAALRNRVLGVIASSPTPVSKILVEVNQGGEMWYSVLHDMPVKVEVVWQGIPKEIRAANLLNHYQRGHVEHLKVFAALEEQMLGYPDVLHDDLIDAVGTAVHHFARRKPSISPVVTNISYI